MVIHQLEVERAPVTTLCQTLGVSRSAYYAWQQDGLCARRREDNRLRPLIRQIFWEHRRRYGARRIVAELADRDEACSRHRVARLMDEMGLMAIQPRTFKPRTTDSRHTLGYSENLLLDAPPAGAINQVWVGDITYVPLAGGDFLYLALLMDLFSRRIIGWDLQNHMQEAPLTAEVVAPLFDQALAYWAAAGLDPLSIQRLDSVQFSIAPARRAARPSVWQHDHLGHQRRRPRLVCKSRVE